MGREILFRGFCPDENGTQIDVVNGKKYKGNWVEGFYSWLPESSLATAFLNNEGCLEAEDFADYILKPITKQSSYFSSAEPLEVCEIETYKVVENTVCQYTGLKDKNGKKIFEGDIMQLCSATYPYTVYWDGIGWAWKVECRRREIDLTRERMKVIGTIFDKEAWNG